ncbi:MAG: biotin transporter BioY [Candidatus Omnitrophica bacterium]|nr:biotin transporter BioY [Candidatus Omnitrophota bacterium]
MSYAHSLDYNKDIINNKKLTAAIGVVFFILATALGAYIRIPVHGSPIPITLQTFFVLLAGAVLGKKLGLYSQAGYILAGISGLPMFQGASLGVSYLLGPTGGYLIGFMICAFIIGLIIDSARSNIVSIIAVFALGSLIIYASGILWLVCMYKMNLTSAIMAGALPFIPGDMAKIAIASAIYSKISRRSRQIFSA